MHARHLAWRLDIPAAKKFKSPFESADFDFRFKRAVYQTLVGNLHEPLALLDVERTFNRDVAVDAVDHAFLGLAIETILGVNLVMGQACLS
jgi:hypothetical protein